VQDSVVQKSEGFIQHYDVLEEKVDGDVMKVRVRATVFESKVQAEVKKLADLIAAAGNPKLMLVLREVYTEPNGQKRVAESIMASYLEKELLARGFELRGGGFARKMAAGTDDAYETWANDTAAVAQAARDEGADIIVTGRVDIHNQGEIKDTGGIDALAGQIRLEIQTLVRGINAASGEVFSSKPVQMKSMGLSEERAVHRAFQGSGRNLVTQIFGDLLEDLKTSFKKAAADGQQYVVSLAGITSYRQQGQRFMDVLKGVNGVQAVTQKSFDKGSLQVDVMCKCSTTELQQRIFNAAEQAEMLKSLDIAGVSGKRLSFQL
jgi:hypothetical protein